MCPEEDPSRERERPRPFMPPCPCPAAPWRSPWTGLPSLCAPPPLGLFPSPPLPLARLPLEVGLSSSSGSSCSVLTSTSCSGLFLTPFS